MRSGAFNLEQQLTGYLTEHGKQDLARKIAEDAEQLARKALEERYPGSDYASGVSIQANGTKIQIKLKGARLIALERGVRPHSMTYLAGKTVPIRTPQGIIYRKVTALALMRGKWKHPGREGEYIVQDAIDQAVQQAGRYGDALKDNVRSTIGVILKELGVL